MMMMRERERPSPLPQKPFFFQKKNPFVVCVAEGEGEDGGSGWTGPYGKSGSKLVVQAKQFTIYMKIT